MDDNDLQKRHYFAKELPRHRYAYLKRRKHIVIPKILMKEGMLCDMSNLALDKHLPSESVLVFRENYAKQALMMFYPHRTNHDLRSNGSFGASLFKLVGLTSYTPNVNVMDNNCLREPKHFLEKARIFSTIFRRDKPWNMI